MTGATVDRSLPVLELTGEATSSRILLRDLRRAASLLPLLAKQDYVARYRSAALGLLWSVFLPLIQGAVLAVIFSHVVKIKTGGQAYPVFVFVGVSLWAFVSTSWTAGATAIVDGSSIASRVYFPRLLLPAVPAMANMPALVISNAIAVLAMPVFGVAFRPGLVLLPVAMVFAAMLVVALSAVTTLLHVYFRDVRYIVSAVVLVAFYATPVIYPIELASRTDPRARHRQSGHGRRPAFAICGLRQRCGRRAQSDVHRPLVRCARIRCPCARTGATKGLRWTGYDRAAVGRRPRDYAAGGRQALQPDPPRRRPPGQTAAQAPLPCSRTRNPTRSGLCAR